LSLELFPLATAHWKSFSRLFESMILWLTLAEVHDLMPRAVFNNEARSATSLLLSLA
jgi:hypothetical protein